VLDVTIVAVANPSIEKGLGFSAGTLQWTLTAYALSYGGAESLTHYLKSFLAELDLCLAICGFKDIASLKEAGCEQALTFR